VQQRAGGNATLAEWNIWGFVGELELGDAGESFMQECCFRLQLAGKRKSTQLLCVSAILLLVIVNSALYSRSLAQVEQIEKMKKELLKPPAKRAVDPQYTLQISSPPAIARQLNPSDAPNMIALDRALTDALSSMASACSSTTTCYPHCDTPAAPAQSRIDAAARFQSVRVLPPLSPATRLSCR